MKTTPQTDNYTVGYTYDDYTWREFGHPYPLETDIVRFAYQLKSRKILAGTWTFKYNVKSNLDVDHAWYGIDIQVISENGALKATLGSKVCVKHYYPTLKDMYTTITANFTLAENYTIESGNDYLVITPYVYVYAGTRGKEDFLEWGSLIYDCDDYTGLYNIELYTLQYSRTFTEIIGFLDIEKQLPTLTLYPKYILIGKNSVSYYKWSGIKSVKWNDTSPWVHIDIPGGLMVHQHIRSPKVTVTIECIDQLSLFEALFNTVIDNYNKTALDYSNFYVKNEIGYLEIIVSGEDKIEYGMKCFNAKVESLLPLEVIQRTETKWQVVITCDKIDFTLKS